MLIRRRRGRDSKAIAVGISRVDKQDIFVDLVELDAFSATVEEKRHQTGPDRRRDNHPKRHRDVT
jgi:hypothetical protein